MRFPILLLVFILLSLPVFASSFTMNNTLSPSSDGNIYTTSEMNGIMSIDATPSGMNGNSYEENMETNILVISGETNKLSKPQPTSEENVVRVEKHGIVIVEGNITAEDMNRIQKLAQRMMEENKKEYEANGYHLYIEGNQNLIRVKKTVRRVPRKILEKFTRHMGIEENALSSGRFFQRKKIGGKVYVKIALVRPHALVGKEVLFDENRGEAEVNIIITAESDGLYLVEENIPKSGSVEFNVPGKYVVLNFDPVLAWVVSLKQGEEANIHYKVVDRVPPELDPSVTTLAACDVKVKVRKLLSSSKGLSGSFYILLGGTPVYTPDIRVNGNLDFIKDGMYYVFDSKDRKVVIQGSLGDCSFYREINGPQDYTGYIIVAVAVFAILAVLAYAFFR